MEPDECDGCLNYRVYKSLCSCSATTFRAVNFKKIIDVSECPCAECLIKVMCTTQCKDYAESKSKRRAMKDGT